MERKFYKFTFICTVMMFSFNIGIALAEEFTFANDADLIPPEVLKQMDPDIRSGKRPTFATIHQGDIFGLRETPKFDTDFVKFDFAVSNLSTVPEYIYSSTVIYFKENSFTASNGRWSPSSLP